MTVYICYRIYCFCDTQHYPWLYHFVYHAFCGRKLFKFWSG